MSWRSMNALRDRVDEQHCDLERCESLEDYARWLAKYRPGLLAQFPERVQKLAESVGEQERMKAAG